MLTPVPSAETGGRGVGLHGCVGMPFVPGSWKIGKHLYACLAAVYRAHGTVSRIKCYDFEEPGAPDGRLLYSAS
jgi:hypothetical protein